jgi:hypothetical protein
MVVWIEQHLSNTNQKNLSNIFNMKLNILLPAEGFAGLEKICVVAATRPAARVDTTLNTITNSQNNKV